jgi:mRNA (guanine-N7-)-methyltransferase
MVSTQFAIHYMFESENKLRAYLRNVTDRLNVGGFFIGTTVDSDELVYRIRNSPTKDNSVKNDFYEVVFP